MKFIDEVEIKVQAGRGGDGIISFRREYRVDRGGPDGGDGGRGGSIFFEGATGLNTLLALRDKKHIIGHDGTNGKRKNMYGAKGADLVIKVPLGTIVSKAGQVLVDITAPQRYLIARGGAGGRGNTKFKTARNTAPRLSERGARGEAATLKLELKVLANIGLVGKPSAGKSTLLAKLSNAKPKIASYDFTTLVPQLGITRIDQTNVLVIADLPGLIASAAAGKGLGHTFLRHIERCRVIAHVLDFGTKTKDPRHDFATIKQELANYSPALLKRAQVVIANKMDQEAVFATHFKNFQTRYPKIAVIAISALQEQGLTKLKQTLWAAFQTDVIQVATAAPAKTVGYVSMPAARNIIIEKPFRGLFELKGKAVARVYDRIPLTSWENFQRFNSLLKRAGVWDKLIANGVRAGDTVRIFGYEFEWHPEEH